MERNRIKLIALDLDGTLLTTDKALTAENEAALRRAAEAGIEIVPATGRFYGAIPENVRSLPYLHYAITVNGAEIYDIRNQQSLFQSVIPWQRAVEVLEYLDSLPVIYDCYMDGWGWMSQAHYARSADFAPTKHSLEMLQKLRTPVPELKAHLAAVGHGVQKLMMFFQDMELRARAMEELALRFPDLAVTSSIPRNVELNSMDARKGVALTRLAEYLGAARTETMAFGDDLNDVSMLEAAGIGVAMANAGPEARAAADFVTGSCDESGVARALDRLIFGEEDKA
ncbi:MAG: HAD family phosphatase [Oscillospiraceae bacterium]|nr:HAD family phosphatase [Oscillospiraceae bacterium]